MPLELEELTGRIIGAAIDVHKVLGPGFLESVYEVAMSVELRHRGIPFVRQHPVPIVYRGVDVGLHKLDLFVGGEVVVELKAVRELAPEHFSVVRSYLRAVGKEHGLLLNFTAPSGVIKRVFARPMLGSRTLAASSSSWLLFPAFLDSCLPERSASFAPY